MYTESAKAREISLTEVSVLLFGLYSFIYVA